MNQEKIGRFIASVRKDRGLTQDDIARKLGITSQSVSKWERGINFPDVLLIIDLCVILDISVDELLNGERNSLKGNINEQEVEICTNNKRKKYKKYVVIFMVLVLLLLSVIGMKIFINKEEESLYESINQDSFIVNESLNYIRFDSNVNKSLLQKLFDNNEGILSKDDLSNDEKMFLVLNYYKRENKLNGTFNARFDSLKGLIFEDSLFLTDYGKEGANYSVQNRINYSCYNGIFNYEEMLASDEKEKNIYFNVIDAKKNNYYLIIDFKIAFLYSQDYSNFVAFYKKIDSYNYIMLKNMDEVEIEKEKLGEEFNTFRFVLKLVNGKPYFESLEKIK